MQGTLPSIIFTPENQAGFAGKTECAGYFSSLGHLLARIRLSRKSINPAQNSVNPVCFFVFRGMCLDRFRYRCLTGSGLLNLNADKGEIR